MEANSATAIADEMVVLLEPEPLMETKSAPHAALAATATHIATIAMDAHISLTKIRADQPSGSCTTLDGSCGTVVISHLLPAPRSHGGDRRASGTGRIAGARKYASVPEAVSRESHTIAGAQVLPPPQPAADRTWTTALHVTNGDSTVPGLRATGLAHRIVCWRDALHEGPVPDVPDDELRRIRARFLDGENAADLGIREELAERDRMLESNRDGDYVLWFEADLYDQLQLIQILAKLHELKVPAGRITLICIGEFPGIAHFGGLGELEADQLSRLPAMAATPLTVSALEHATRAWTRFRAPDPGGLGEIAAKPLGELRFVAEAFDRLSREYPSTRDGLSLTERRILAAVADGAPPAGAAFIRVGARETRPFLGDTWCFDAMTRLAQAPNPLLEAEPSADPVGPHSRLRLTGIGRRVLDGDEDHIALNGINRWIGGVHLHGRELAWRWDEGTERITGHRS